jgi:hypothetical protein
MKKAKTKTLIAILTVAIMLLIPIVAMAADPPAPVPKTGVTTSQRTGDDGYHQKGVASPKPRFMDNGDGTVTDNLTGLMWAKDANLASGSMNWNDAIDYANNLSLGSDGCGLSYTDWRLPNRFELESLLDLSNSPALPLPRPFKNFEGTYYWSSTTYTNNLNIEGWCLHPAGYWCTHVKDHTYGVWPVRSAD